MPKKHVLKNMKIREISLVEAGMNQHADVILMKSRDGQTLSLDPVLVSAIRKADDGSDASDASDGPRRSDPESLANIARAAIRKPPVGSESVEDWKQRVFGDAADTFEPQEALIADKIYEQHRHRQAIQKSAAGILDALAKQIVAADPSKSFYRAFAEAARTPAGRAAYAISKGQARTDLQAGEADDGVGDQQEGGDDPMAFLNDAAAEIQQAENCSREQAFLKAAQQHPSAYGRLRSGGSNPFRR